MFSCEDIDDADVVVVPTLVEMLKDIESPYEVCSKLIYLYISPSSPPIDNTLSYDVCLEVREEIIRTVLCCIVY